MPLGNPEIMDQYTKVLTKDIQHTNESVTVFIKSSLITSTLSVTKVAYEYWFGNKQIYADKL